MSYGVGYLFGQLGSAVPAVSLPACCAAPGCLLVGWGKRQRRPWLCVSAAQQ